MAAERLPLLVIVGPTAAGKSALAMTRAQASSSEIVSADSVQVYRGLDIGAAKPTAAEREAVPHHGLDLWNPSEQANAGAWVAAVEPVLERLHAEGRVPVVCGGTGLWVRALLEGLAEVPEVPSEVRDAVRGRLEQEGAPALHAALTQVDPRSAAKISPGDSQRVSRAFEVYLATGTPLSSFQDSHRQRLAADGRRYAAHLVGVFPERGTLEQRIAERAARMVDEGLVDEVRGLLGRGVPSSAPALQTLGYREIVRALEDGLPARDVLVRRLATAHRRYAKRQLTWWRDVTFDERAG